MEYANIQGFKVPKLGFGTWRMKGEQCRAAVMDALAIGYRHIDTVQEYDNEADVGEAIEQSDVDRSDVFLTTKVWMDKLRPDDLRESVARSLDRLRTDHVDLLLIHWPNDDVPLAATLDAMKQLKDEGKTLQIGVSNFTEDLTRQALQRASIFCNQVEYHPYLDQTALLRQCRNHGMLLTAYCPLARGRVSDDRELRDIGRPHGKSPAQVALRWLVQQSNVAAIPKASSAQHRRENFAVFDFELSEAEMKLIGDKARQKRIVSPSHAPWVRAAS